MLRTTLNILYDLPSPIRWLSIEPLSFNVAPILADDELRAGRRPLEWTVIGAASNGPRLYQPDPIWVMDALVTLDRLGTKVHFKENLKTPLSLLGRWREDYPEVINR